MEERAVFPRVTLEADLQRGGRDGGDEEAEPRQFHGQLVNDLAAGLQQRRGRREVRELVRTWRGSIWANLSVLSALDCWAAESWI